jgi:uncharacterized membrane protein (Fun14 family)
MFVAIIVLCVIGTFSSVLSFLTLAATGRVSLDQRALRNEIADRCSESVDRLEQLTQVIDSSMDCLVTLDAKSSKSGVHAE